ncbi:energy-coupling factor transporter ATPase [bacterium]|nr:energy-coupling factor transporter ATPase [bacterium]
MIQFEDVHFSYNTEESENETTPRSDGEVIKGLSFSIGSGEFVCILGANGSGKTTVGKLINSLILPVSGKIVIDGLAPDSEENILKIRQTVGMVFQDPSRQMVASTIEDELAFGPENLGVEPREILQRIDWALKILDLESLRYREPHYLSGGQTQRAAIAGVLVMQPKYIVMDEPTAMLDPKGRRSVLEAIDFLRAKLGLGIIYITHHMEEVLRCDRVLGLKEGQLIFEGSPRDLFSEEATLKELGLQVPPVIELANLLRQRGCKLQQSLSWQELCSALTSVWRN